MRKLLLSLVVCLLLINTLSCTAASGQTVRVGWFHLDGMQDYHPEIDTSNGTDPTDVPGVWGGYQYEYLKTIGQYTGWNYEFVRGTYAQCLRWLQEGNIDLIGMMSKSPEREKKYAFNNIAYTKNAPTLVTHTSNERYAFNDFSGFDGMRIASMPNSYQSETVQKFAAAHGFRITLLPISAFADMQKAMDQGEADVMLLSGLQDLHGLKVLAVLPEQDVYFMAMPRNKGLLQELDQALTQIQFTQPDYNNLLFNKYFANTRSPGISFTKEEQRYLEARRHSNKAVLVSYDPDWYPITYTGSSATQISGIMASIFTQLSKTTGLKFRFIPTTNSQDKADDPPDVELNAAISTDFPWADQHGFKLSQAILDIPIYEAKGPGNPHIIALVQNSHLAQSVVARYLEDNEAAQESVQFLYYKNTQACLEALQKKQAGCTYLNAYEANYYNAHNQLRDLKVLSVPGFSEHISIGIAKNSTPLLFTIISRALRSITPDQLNDFIILHSNPKQDTTLRDSIAAHPYASLFMGFFVFFLVSCSGLLYYSKKKTLQQKLLLETANHAKSDFLSRMSHDIRTPMNAIIGLTEIAKQGTNEPSTKCYLQEISISSTMLLDLINNVLDLSKLESQTLILHKEPYPLADFKTLLASTIGAPARKKGVQYKYRADDSLSGLVTDRIRFNQIFINLLSNALKFTPSDGSIAITLHCLSRQDNKAQLQILVEDTGIGMEADFVQHMYEPFVQEDADHAGTGLGTGLGLAIVYKIVQAFQGTISVTTAKNKGTKFTVELPVTLCTPPHNTPAAVVSNTNLRGKHLLIVEDNLINQKVVGKLLTNEGMTYEVANNGQEALTKFTQLPAGTFAAILMDMRMPVMSGMEATKRIRHLPRADAQSIPIIALTADAYVDAKAKIIASGTTAYLAKPVYPQELYGTLQTYLQ